MPRYMWVNGKQINWEDAQVHVWNEVAVRGVSVFEGIACLWDPTEGSHSAIGLHQHWRRLRRSASLVHVPEPLDFGDLCQLLGEASVLMPDSDFYVRPTIMAISGRSTADANSQTDWFAGAFPMANEPELEEMTAVLYPHSRSGGPVPPGAKAAGSYLDFRRVMEHRQTSGASASIMMDHAGNIVEADGAGLLLINDGMIVAPLESGHALESITRRVLLNLAEHKGIAIQHRPVHWSEAHGAQLVTCGTLSGVRLATLVESQLSPAGSDRELAKALMHDYYSFVRHGQDLTALSSTWRYNITSLNV